MSGRKPPKGKKNISMQIDESTYKIMDIFKYNADLLNQGQFIFNLSRWCYNSYHIIQFHCIKTYQKQIIT